MVRHFVRHPVFNVLRAQSMVWHFVRHSVYENKYNRLLNSKVFYIYLSTTAAIHADWWCGPSSLITKAIYVKCNIEARSCNHYYSGKAKSIIYYECVFVALRIQHAKCMCHIVTSDLPRSTAFFYIISQKAEFWKKKSYWIQNGLRFSLQFLSETFFVLRRTERDMTKSVYRSACKVPFILVRL